MKNPLKTLGPNINGRDFVVGDLHGSYSAFLNLLKGINFDKNVDRMISVGDLVDRGPDSVSCLWLLYEPWFHSVLSNHEQMMIGKFNGHPAGQYWFQNGGQWGMEAYNDYKHVFINQDKERIVNDLSMKIIDTLTYLEELPFLITVSTKAGKKFHIMHAELPPGRHVTDESLTDPAKVRALATIKSGEGDAFLWSRFMFGQYYSVNIDDKDALLNNESYRNSVDFFNSDLSHIISGHTIVCKPMTLVGQTNIDTGAFGSYWTPAEPYSSSIPPEPWARLTCVELDTWTFYQATDTIFEITEPCVVTAKDIADTRAKNSYK